MSQCLLSQIVEALGEPSPEEIIKYNYSGGVFNECRNLISVTFEEGSNLEKIPDYTFYMSDVKYIVVPDRLNKIGGSLAFSPCSNNNQSYNQNAQNQAVAGVAGGNVAGAKFCPNCGNPTNGSNFCPNCGNKLN